MPAYAADLAFTCSGAFKPVDEKEPPRTISNETLIIGLASKTVSGVIGPYDIDEIGDKLVKFSITLFTDQAYIQAARFQLAYANTDPSRKHERSYAALD